MPKGMAAKSFSFKKLSWDLHLVSPTYIALVRTGLHEPLRCKGVWAGKYLNILAFYEKKGRENLARNDFGWLTVSAHTPSSYLSEAGYVRCALAYLGSFKNQSPSYPQTRIRISGWDPTLVIVKAFQVMQCAANIWNYCCIFIFFNFGINLQLHEERYVY